MKPMTLFAAIFLIAISAQAGVKEGGGDVGASFHCESLPNVDSRLNVTATGASLSSPMNLLVTAGDKIEVTDRGRIVWSSLRFVGQVFEIRFDSEQMATITALQPNAILSVGSSEQLKCELPAGA